MDSDHATRPETDASPFERAHGFIVQNALWIQIAIGIVAWIALLLAYPLQSTTPIYANY